MSKKLKTKVIVLLSLLFSLAISIPLLTSLSCGRDNQQYICNTATGETCFSVLQPENAKGKATGEWCGYKKGKEVYAGQCYKPQEKNKISEVPCLALGEICIIDEKNLDGNCCSTHCAPPPQPANVTAQLEGDTEYCVECEVAEDCGDIQNLTCVFQHCCGLVETPCTEDSDCCSGDCIIPTAGPSFCGGLES